jgi:hypothetical protein
MGLRELAARFEISALERAVERDVEAELEAHLAQAAAELEAGGTAPDDARRMARERFGDLERIRAECLRIRMGGMHAMNKLLVGALVAVSFALLATLGASYMLYTRARMAHEVAMAAQVEARYAADRAREVEAEAKDKGIPQEIIVEVSDELQLVESMHPELQVKAVVQADGKALIPDAGWIGVAGLTRGQVEQLLRERLAPFYEELQLFVIVHKPGSAQPKSLKAPITTFTSALFRTF